MGRKTGLFQNSGRVTSGVRLTYVNPSSLRSLGGEACHDAKLPFLKSGSNNPLPSPSARFFVTFSIQGHSFPKIARRKQRQQKEGPLQTASSLLEILPQLCSFTAHPHHSSFISFLLLLAAGRSSDVHSMSSASSVLIDAQTPTQG